MRRQEHRIEIKKRTSLFEKRNGKPDRVSKSEVFCVAADKRFLPSGGISKAGMKR